MVDISTETSRQTPRHRVSISLFPAMPHKLSQRDLNIIQLKVVMIFMLNDYFQLALHCKFFHCRTHNKLSCSNSNCSTSFSILLRVAVVWLKYGKFVMKFTSNHPRQGQESNQGSLWRLGSWREVLSTARICFQK